MLRRVVRSKHNTSNMSCYCSVAFLNTVIRFNTTGSSSSSSITSPADLLAYKKRAHALFLLKKTPHVALSSEAALRLVTDEAGQTHIPPAEQMSRAEAADFLRACHDAGLVIISPAPGTPEAASAKTQMVYPDPVAVFDAAKSAEEAGTLDGENVQGTKFLVQAKENRARKIKRMLAQRAHHELEPDEEHKYKGHTHELTEDADLVAARAVRSHRRFWAFIAFGMSCQMLLFAYWTFLVYDWDAMEPFTYFVSCGYMILLFAYFVSTKRAHTFVEMDREVLKRAVHASAKTMKK